MKIKKIITLGAIGLFLILGASSHGIGWALVNAKVRHDFPEVKRITPSELAAWLNDRARPAPLLLDVRTRPEYEVSHLRNAQHVEPDAAVSAIRADKDQPIVTYCSVGYRSGAFAEKLRAAGYTNVVNLSGSIFQWTNEGRPLVRDGEETDKVHSYNKTWGLLLQKKHRADVPSVSTKS
jgi:rhodanese-related sulfurtransferase